MYTKILLVVIILVLSAFFYLHTQNPGTITFVVNGQNYVMPATMLLFTGFFGGVVLAVLNSILVDARRAYREFKARKEKKLLAQADENYRKGTDLLVKGDTTGARELMDRALKAKPSETGIIISLSETYIRENKPKEAVKILENGFLNNPSSIGILSALARCAADSGDIYRAAKALDEVVRLDPKNLYALRRLRDLRIGDGLWAEAARLQKSVLECERDEEGRKKEKKLLTGLLFEASSRSASEGNLAEAMVTLKEALRCDQSFLPANLLLGDIFAKQGNAASAIKVWEKAHTKHNGSVPLMLRLEDAFLKESAPERILDRYKKEIQAHPNDAGLRLLLARLYLRLEMVDNAIEELERLHAEGEDGFYAQVLLGEAYFRRKQGGRAAHLFQKALGLDREIGPPFVCSCGTGAASWAPRCPSCGEWNTFAMKGASSPKIAAQPKKPF